MRRPHTKSKFTPTKTTAPVITRPGFPAWLMGVFLVLATFLAYQPVWHAGFIWDDDYYVTNNLTLRSLDGLRQIWFNLAATPQYYPLVHTSFWLEYHLWGLNPLGYHIANVLLHSLAAILLWRVLVRLQLPGAFLAAGIFRIASGRCGIGRVGDGAEKCFGRFPLLGIGAGLLAMDGTGSR